MKSILLNVFLVLLLSSSIYAQQEEFERPNSIEGKVIFTDHYTPLDSTLNGFENIANAFEIGYHRHLSNLLTIGVPIKIGVAKVPGTQFDNRITLSSADVVLRLRLFTKERKLAPYIFAGVGGAVERDLGAYGQAPFGAGIHFKVIPWGYISAQAEYRYTFGDTPRNNLQYGIGFLYMLGKPEIKEEEPEDVLQDRDMDGIADSEDDCPDVAGVVAFNGCPDTDEDSIPDKDDKCPDVAGLLETMGCPDQDGDGFADMEDDCPEEPGVLNGCPDFDGDGVADKDDECPEQAGTAENNGCPEGTDSDGDGFMDDKDDCPNQAGPLNGCPDRDSDGIRDQIDLCPDEAGLENFNGCPDSDGDGIGNHLDVCPFEAGPSSNRGCPEINDQELELLEYATQAVRFETGSARLKSESYIVLDEIVSIMRRYPHYALKISGHTDNVGSSSNNEELSEKRAKACFSYIKDQNISKLRLSYIGFGEERPRASNDDRAGRRLNRRVEFDLFLQQQ